MVSQFLQEISLGDHARPGPAKSDTLKNGWKDSLLCSHHFLQDQNYCRICCLINAPIIFLLNFFWSKIVPLQNLKTDSDFSLNSQSESNLFFWGTIFDQEEFKRKMAGAFIKQRTLRYFSTLYWLHVHMYVGGLKFLARPGLQDKTQLAGVCCVFKRIKSEIASHLVKLLPADRCPMRKIMMNMFEQPKLKLLTLKPKKMHWLIFLPVFQTCWPKRAREKYCSWIPRSR